MTQIKQPDSESSPTIESDGRIVGKTCWSDAPIETKPVPRIPRNCGNCIHEFEATERPGEDALREENARLREERDEAEADAKMYEENLTRAENEVMRLESRIAFLENTLCVEEATLSVRFDEEPVRPVSPVKIGNVMKELAALRKENESLKSSIVREQIHQLREAVEIIRGLNAAWRKWNSPFDNTQMWSVVEAVDAFLAKHGGDNAK